MLFDLVDVGYSSYCPLFQLVVHKKIHISDVYCLFAGCWPPLHWPKITRWRFVSGIGGGGILSWTYSTFIFLNSFSNLFSILFDASFFACQYTTGLRLNYCWGGGIGHNTGRGDGGGVGNGVGSGDTCGSGCDIRACFLIMLYLTCRLSMLVLTLCFWAVFSFPCSRSLTLSASVPDFIIYFLCTLIDQYDTHHVSGFSLGLRNSYSTLNFKYT